MYISRFQLSHQCQSTRSHEKKTPLPIKSLALNYDGIRVNATFCHLTKIKNAKRSKPGESAGGSAVSQIQFSFGCHLERLVHRPELEALEYMIKNLFGGRSSIKIQEFQLSDLKYMKITESLRIKTKAFEWRIILTTKLDNLKLPVNRPTLFTLSLIGCRPNTSHLNSQILKISDILNFEYARISDEIMTSLRHKKVKFLYLSQYTTILVLFKHWF